MGKWLIISNYYIDHEAAAGSTEPPITSFSDIYGEDLEQQLLLLLDEDQEIMDGSPEYLRVAATSPGELVASVHNYTMSIVYIGKLTT